MSENNKEESILDSLPENMRKDFVAAPTSSAPQLTAEEMEKFRQFQAMQAQETGAPVVTAEQAEQDALSHQDEGHEISETFSSLSQGGFGDLEPVISGGPVITQGAPATVPQEGPINVQAQAPKVVPMSPLDNIVVDLNSVEFVEKSPMEQQRDYDEIFTKKKKTSVYQVVAAQSGYGAMLSALNLSDINSITNSNVDLYTHKKRLYEAIHAHIESTTVGKIGFKDWLKSTSFHDLETLMYGIYCQTFPENNQFDVTCGSCNKSTPLVVSNVTLVEVRDQEIYGKIDEILRTINSLEKLPQASLVHKTERFMLPESKIMMEIHTPSLWDHLELLNTVDAKYIREHNDTIGTMLFIKGLYMPDLDAIRRTGKYSVYPVADRNRQIDILLQLSIKDGDFMNEKIQKRAEKYAITYSVKGAKCSHCSDSLGDLPIDIENALFTLIQRRNQG